MSSNTKQDNQSCKTLMFSTQQRYLLWLNLKSSQQASRTQQHHVEEELLSRFNNEDRTTTYTQALITVETTSKDLTQGQVKKVILSPPKHSKKP